MDQPAQPFHVAFPGGGQHRTRTEKQQALEQRMIEDVKQSGSQCQCGIGVHVIALKRQGQPQTNEDDADVFYRVISKQSFQIVLHQCVQHTQHCSNATQGQHRSSPPPCWRAQQIEYDANEAVYRHLGHDSTHQGRYVAGRSRMR